MRHDFEEFLRHGGHAQFVFSGVKGRVHGYRPAYSVKSNVPNHSALRSDFTALLDETIAENSRMLVVALNPPDTDPVMTQTDLRDVTDAKDEALRR